MAFDTTLTAQFLNLGIDPIALAAEIGGGGDTTGIINLRDPGGAIQSLRNITFAAPASNVANKPLSLNTTWTGVNLDPPAGGQPLQATSITNTFNNYNTGSLGARGLFVNTSVGPLTIGATFSAVTSTVVQTAPHPPGLNLWATSTTYATNFGLVNPNNGLVYYAVTGGTSASSGTGPSGTGQAIVDGSVTWAYQGPGIARYWAATTSYPTKGELVTNPNNGGLFRVETPGTSGSNPGPVRPRAARFAARVASTANVASLSGLLTIDGIVTVAGDRVLLKDQTAGEQNGVYVAAAGAWVRSNDMDTWDELVSVFVPVTLGTVNAGLGFLNTNVRNGTIDTTPITWVQSTAPNVNAITDGTVTWSLRTIGSAAQSWIGLIANAQLGFNAGGKSYNESVGSSWGAVIGSRLNPLATWYSASVPLEVDDNMQGSCRNIMAQKIVRLGKQAAFTDVGLTITAAIGSLTLDGFPVRGYKNAMMFNSSVDRDNGYGIAFEAIGAYRQQHMCGAIDTRMVVPDGTLGAFGGGFIYRHFNGMLDGAGAWQLRHGSITPTSSGLTIDVTNQELVSIAITNGGSNWSVGDGWKGSDGSAGAVVSVDSNGAILTVNYGIRAQVPSSAVPSTVTLSPFNLEAPFAAVGNDPDPLAVGPTGDGFWPVAATGTPTYAAPTTPTIALGPTTKIVNIGSGTTEVITGNRATGATTDTQGHFYIPFVAGTPTGVPTNHAQGAAIRFDTTAHKLWVYDHGASAWKSVALT